MRLLLKKLSQTIFLCLGCCTGFGQVPDVKDCRKCAVPEPIRWSVTDLKGEYANFFGEENSLAPRDTYTYYQEFILKNSDTAEKRIVVSLGSASICSAYLFQKRFGNWTYVGPTGSEFYHKRSYAFAHPSFSAKLAANSIDTFFLQVSPGTDFRKSHIAVFQEPAMSYFENQFYFTLGIIIGLLILFLFLSVYLLFAIKESIHAWYSAYILLMLTIVTAGDHLLYQFIHLEIEGGMISALYTIAVAVLIQVLQPFFTVMKNPKAARSRLNFIKGFLLVAGIGTLIILVLWRRQHFTALVFEFLNCFSLLGLLALLASCIYSIAKDFRMRWFIIGGVTLAIVGLIQRGVFDSYGYGHPLKFYHVALVLEITFISFVLIYRYRLERSENIRLLQEKEQLAATYKKQLLQNKIEVQEKTFKNISQEIHDNIGQLLTLAKINLDTVSSTASNEYAEKISKTEDLLHKSQTDLYKLSRSLQAEHELPSGVVHYLESELELIKKTSLIETQLTIDGQAFEINRETETVLHRIFQEIFNNIIKHSNANKVAIQLAFQQPILTIKISDNGRGFSLSDVQREKGGSGLGMRNMQDRAKKIGARLHVESNPGAGTLITISVTLT